MPKIIIREIDKTKAGLNEYSNFSVVVPGFCGNTTIAEGIFDANGIYECSSQDDFVTNIGKRAAGEDGQMGNQIAYELLGLGYTVLYKRLANNVSEMKESDYWDCLKDRSTYDFRYICTGGYADVDVYNNIIKVAASKKDESITDPNIYGRGDCCALIDIDESNFLSTLTDVKNIQNYIDSLKKDNKSILNKYSAVFAPKVTYDQATDTYYEENVTFPASFHFLACAAYARSVKNFREWYAVAGYQRGICEKTVASTSLVLGEIAINALQPRYNNNGTNHSVNLVTKIRKEYYLWGSRTAHALKNSSDKDAGLVASHFLNIRDLCSTLKKDIWNACKELTFDPNSDLLWANFQNKIKPTLETMKADQGIEDYKIVKVVNKEKALLTAKVRIVPVEPVEDFDISIYLEDSIAGVTVSTDEE